MATLVHLLASGVNGAANGTATFVLRGTASSAASIMFNDFEMTSQPGTNIITLDANGAAEVYVNAYVDVTLKTSSGATLRTVTVGTAATTVEVVSDSFTGTDYSGSPSGVNKPITLAAVLDKWNNSAGSIDWKILVNGVSTNISSAFAGVAGLFFNVKDPAYGAVGDGVTDDTTAIGSAITAAAAAGGGIVFFPSSTSFYKFTALTIASSNITLMGAGPKSSVLRSATTSTVITLTGGATGDWLRIIDLGVICTAVNSNPLITGMSGINVLIRNCEFDATTLTGSVIRKLSGSSRALVLIEDTKILVGASVASCFNNAADDNVCFIKLTNCFLTVTAGFTGSLVLGPNFSVEKCTFDASAVTSGIYRHINATSAVTAGKYLGSFIGNEFMDGGSAGFAFQLVNIATASNFSEDNNKFIGFADPTSLTDAGHIYNVSNAAHGDQKVHLGSRQGRSFRVSHASTGTVVPIVFCSYQNIFIDYTAAGNLTIQPPISVMTDGAEVQMVLQNNSGSTRDIVLDCGSSVQTWNTTVGMVSPPKAPGSDATYQPNSTERVIWLLKFMQFGGTNPLAYVAGIATA